MNRTCDRCGDTDAQADPIAAILGSANGDTKHYHLGCIPEGRA